MNFRKIILPALVLFTLVFGCKKDDDNDGFTPVPPRDRAEQQLADKDSLLNYLETHYYNYSLFETPGNHTISELLISELPRDLNGNYMDLPNPDENVLLIEAENLETNTITFAGVNYEYYVLRLNTGGGENPNFTDKIRVIYSGSLLDGFVFDSTINPVQLELMDANGLGVIEGWRRVLPGFKTAESFTILDDNTISYSNYGLGVMFLPSGLGYFASPTEIIPAYSNLIFKFQLLQSEVSDHDNDGIPSYREDTDGNDDIFDDTDGDLIPDFVDVDDDNDGVNTIDELEAITYIVNTNAGETEPVLDSDEFERSRDLTSGILTIHTVKIVDSNSNDIPDYLESSISINYNE